jgi:hypothetical protein
MAECCRCPSTGPWDPVNCGLSPCAVITKIGRFFTKSQVLLFLLIIAVNERDTQFLKDVLHTGNICTYI